MSYQWKKYGLVIVPNKKIWWMCSHAMMPTPFHVGGSKYKIYFAGRNALNQSHIGYALVDLEDPKKVLEYSAEPVLSPGRLGTFDDNGVLASCLLRVGSEILLYYVGFKPGGTTRMELFGGLAVSKDDGVSFTRWSEAPILERTRLNPFINTAPWVVQDQGQFKMYYVAGCEWLNRDLPKYNIQVGFSQDGKYWDRNGDVTIDFEGDENALARPFVIKDDNQYKMWFSSKGQSYVARHAVSKDGLSWERQSVGDGIASSIQGVDDEMVCYPIIINHGDKTYMYYNGNGYGLHGICLAISERSWA